LPELASKIYDELKYDFNVYYEEKMPLENATEDKMLLNLFCITVDHDSLADGTVAKRKRHEEERVKIEDLRKIIDFKVNF
jgi:glycyl-tRNA synthetase